jgi:hypothetical protein
MPWIGDVAPYDTIQSLWGNTIRDHVVQVVGSKAERDATIAPKEGMVVHVTDTHITYVRVGSAWWVLGMPPRSPGTILGYAAPLSSAWSTMAPSSGGFSWRQAMGHGTLLGSAGYMVPLTGVNYWIAFALPVAATFGSPMGTARVYVASKGTISGGHAAWMDNGGTGGVSRLIVGTAGQDLAATAVVNCPAGQGAAINIDVAVSFMCDPTADVP